MKAKASSLSSSSNSNSNSTGERVVVATAVSSTYAASYNRIIVIGGIEHGVQ